jgi:hypothetical protein
MIGRCTAALFVTILSMVPMTASAISVDVAKRCNVLLEKQFPLRIVGNPTAGSAKGSGKHQRVLSEVRGQLRKGR